MGRGKEKNVLEYCIDGHTLGQVIGEKGLKKIKEYILTHDASCPPKRFINCLDKHYLTLPEGIIKLNDKREEYDNLVNMKGDSNTPHQRKLCEAKIKGRKIKAELICNQSGKEENRQKNAQKYIKSTDQSPNSKKKKPNVDGLKCPCPVGKIILSDTEAQTDELCQKKNKKTNILRRNIVKSDSACPCIGNQSKKTKKPNTRRRRSRTVSIWSRKEKDEANPVKIKSYRQTETKSRSVSPRCPKLKETAAFPTGNTLASCPGPTKDSNVKHKNICTRGICSEAYESKSLIDVKKLKSLIKCMCKKSKKMLSKKKRPPHQPVCEPEVCRKDFKVSLAQSGKKKHKKLPKETECFIAIPENACDGTGDLIIRIKNTSKIKNEGDKFTRTNQNNACDQTGELLLNIKDPCNIKKKKTVRKTEISKTINETRKNAGYQSGEPLQIQVDPVNRCILNPDEIKYKLTNLNQVKKPTCSPSCNAGREECEGKICQKMFKDKKTNFNCKCQHIKDIGVECTDRTCGSKFIKRKYNKCSKLCVESPKLTEPQFEVKLDTKKMCILNLDEVNDKIIEKETDICPGGTCAIACEKGNIFRCKCVQKSQEDIRECTEPTCVDAESERQVDLWYYLMSKLLSKVPVSSNNRMRRSPFDTNEIKKIKSVFSFIRERLKRTSEIWDGSEAPKNKSCSLSGMKPQQNYTVNYANYHRRSGLKLPLQRSRQIRTSTTRNVAQPSSLCQCPPSSCRCYQSSLSGSCRCAKVLAKRKKMEEKEINKRKRQLKKKIARQRKLERKKIAKQEKKLSQDKLQMETSKEPDENTCFGDCILGTFGIGIGIIQCFFMALYKMITKPKKTIETTREWMHDPKHTFLRVRRWMSYKWRVQTLHMTKSIKSSPNLYTLMDEAKDSRLYQAFSNKGNTPKDRQRIEAETKRRQRRMRKKAAKALYGCRDILLVTMRKTPCLWVYHICPDFYPRFLSLRTNFIKLLQMFLFCFAVIVWTPCILCMELCRGFVCCVSCPM